MPFRVWPKEVNVTLRSTWGKYGVVLFVTTTWFGCHGYLVLLALSTEVLKDLTHLADASLEFYSSNNILRVGYNNFHSGRGKACRWQMCVTKRNQWARYSVERFFQSEGHCDSRILRKMTYHDNSSYPKRYFSFKHAIFMWFEQYSVKSE